MLLRSSFALALLFLLTGCSTTRYVVDVDSYRDATQEPASPPAAIHVFENPNAENPLLEREVRSKVERLLTEQGYRLAAYEQADYVVILGYGIGDGRQVQGNVPIYRPGQTIRVNTTDSQGNSTTSTARTSGRVDYVPVTGTVFDRWLAVQALDGRALRERGETTIVWQCETSSAGVNSDLRGVLNYLLIPTIDRFGESTGRRERVTIPIADRRVRELQE